MIEERLEDFMSHVEIKNDRLAEYVNEEKGIRYPLNTPQLLCRVDKLELAVGNDKEKRELDIAKVKQQIEDKEYKIVDLTRIVPKSEITKKDEDMFTLTEKTFKGAIIYNVSNQIGIHNSLENQEEAFTLCEKINRKVFEELCK